MTHGLYFYLLLFFPSGDWCPQVSSSPTSRWGLSLPRPLRGAAGHFSCPGQLLCEFSWASLVSSSLQCWAVGVMIPSFC